MDRNIVKMARSEGDVLTRMKKEYVGTDAANVNFRSVLVPEQEASYMKRAGGEYTVTKNDVASSVFASFGMAVIPAGNIPAEAPIHDDAVINQAAASIEKVDDFTYRVNADFASMVKFASDDPYQASLGEFYWLGISISTGEASIIGLLYNGVALGEADVADATSLSLSAGTFVLWMKLDEGARTILLGKGDKATAITIEVVDTAK